VVAVVGEQVPGDHADRVADGDGGLAFPDAANEPPVLRSEVGGADVGCGDGASATSVLRPGTIFTCLAFTNFRSNARSSSPYQIGFHYGPVASITTSVTPFASSQPAGSFTLDVNVAKTLSSPSRPWPEDRGVRTQATTSSLPTSNPAQRSTTTSTRHPSPETVRRAWQGQPIIEPVRRARSNTSSRREGLRRQSLTRAHWHQGEPSSARPDHRFSPGHGSAQQPGVSNVSGLARGFRPPIAPAPPP